MAPKVLPEMQRRFPALSHLDGTARHQSVAAAQEPWVHALLMAVGKRTGLVAGQEMAGKQQLATTSNN